MDKETKWKSFAKWPKGVGITLGNVHNVSEDTHGNKIQARCACSALEMSGFGGDEKIFPEFTWVEPVLD